MEVSSRQEKKAKEIAIWFTRFYNEIAINQTFTKKVIQMEIWFDDASAVEIKQHLAPENKLIVTFEDGVGPYFQHAIIHM